LSAVDNGPLDNGGFDRATPATVRLLDRSLAGQIAPPSARHFHALTAQRRGR
jgi:hypothetical protein